MTFARRTPRGTPDVPYERRYLSKAHASRASSCRKRVGGRAASLGGRAASLGGRAASLGGRAAGLPVLDVHAEPCVGAARLNGGYVQAPPKLLQPNE